MDVAIPDDEIQEQGRSFAFFQGSCAMRIDRKRRWIITAFKVAVVIIVLLAIRQTLSSGFAEIGKSSWQFRPAWLAAAAVFYLLGLVPAALFWHRVLHKLKQRPALWETLRAHFIGHLGKYVPGKALVVVIRTGLIKSGRVRTDVAAVSVFVETLTMMSVGAFIAAALLAVWFHQQTMLFWLAIGFMVAAGLPILPPVFRRLIRLVGIGKSDSHALEMLDRLGFKTLALGSGLLTLGWFVMGLSLWAVLRSMGLGEANPLVELPRYTASVSLAMVAGFLSLVPGGAVVREAILAKLMVPHLGQAAPALVSAVMLRLVWLFSELLVSGALYLTRSSVSEIVKKGYLFLRPFHPRGVVHRAVNPSVDPAADAMSLHVMEDEVADQTQEKGLQGEEEKAGAQEMERGAP